MHLASSAPRALLLSQAVQNKRVTSQTHHIAATCSLLTHTLEVKRSSLESVGSRKRFSIRLLPGYVVELRLGPMGKGMNVGYIPPLKVSCEETLSASNPEDSAQATVVEVVDSAAQQRTSWCHAAAFQDAANTSEDFSTASRWQVEV